MDFKVGDKVLVFDPKLWNGKDNSTDDFYREAIVYNVSYAIGFPKYIDVKFCHDNRISHGHFIEHIKKL